MALTVSHRCQSISPSPTLAIDARAKEMRASGVDVIGFGAGEPDFPTPQFIIDAANEAMALGKTRYTPASGTYEPNRPITRQEAALILSRAAALCGIFPDQTAALHAADAAQVADWAYDAAAFCVKRGYLTKTNNRIAPTTAITRGDTANAVYALMRDAGLLP